MSAKREGAIARVRKLLALAAEEGGGTEGERNNAAERAQALVLKWRIEDEELARATGRSALPGIKEEGVGRLTMGDHWKYDLYYAVSDPVAVDTVYYNAPKFVRVVNLVGRPDMIAYTKLVVEWIMPQLVGECEVALRLARIDALANGEESGERWGPGDTIRFKRSFYAGATGALKRRLAKGARETSGSTELVRSDRAALDDYYGDDAPVESSRRASELDYSAAAAGHAAGQAVDVDPSNKVGGGDRAEVGS